MSTLADFSTWASENLRYVTSIGWVMPMAIAGLLCAMRFAFPPLDRAPILVQPPSNSVSPERLAKELEQRRRIAETRRADRLERRRIALRHRTTLAELDEEARRARNERAMRAADHASERTLQALYRRASTEGARARIASQIRDSKEARELRVAGVRRWTLRVGLLLLVAFGGWSTSEVHAGVIRVLGLDVGTPAWWAAWAVEPALIGLVAMVLIGRSVLRSAGGDIDFRAMRIVFGALGVSIVLQATGNWPDAMSVEVVGVLLVHSLGPVGAAVTVHLIGIFDDYVAKSHPHEGAAALDAMVLDRRDSPGNVSTAPVAAQPATDAQVRSAEQETPDHERREAPKPGSDEFARAVDEYRFSLMTGNPLSGRQLCRTFGVDPNNRRWPQKVIAAARESIEDEPETVVR